MFQARARVGLLSAGVMGMTAVEGTEAVGGARSFEGQGVSPAKSWKAGGEIGRCVLGGSDDGEPVGGFFKSLSFKDLRFAVGFVWRGGVVRVAAGRRPATSGRLGGALTCPACFRILLEAHAHARPWAWHPADLPYLLVEDWYRHGCRMRKGFRGGCGPGRIPGRASESAARKGFRAERARVRPGRDCGPSGSVGSFGRREFLRCWLPALGRRGLVFSFQRAGKGAFSNQQSALSRQLDKGQNMGGAPQRAGEAERRRDRIVVDG